MVHTIESVKCYPVDMARLNQAVNEFFHKDKPTDSVTYSILSKHALIKTPIKAVIDDEFVGGDITDTITWYVYGEDHQPNGHIIGSCIPSHEITLTLKELEQYLNNPVSLAEFTKERRGYNSRIISNEYAWLRAFNKV